MAKTLLEFTTAVRESFGGRDDKDSLIVSVLNSAQDTLAKEHWEELLVEADLTFTISADAEADAVLSLPSDFKHMHSLSYISGGMTRELISVRPSQWYQAVPQDSWDSRRSIPTHYRQMGREVKVYPPPQDADTLRVVYYKTPATLVNDADVSELLDKDDLILAFAISRVGDALSDYEKAKRYWVQYTNLLDMALKDREPVNRTTVPEHRPGRGVPLINVPFPTDRS